MYSPSIDKTVDNSIDVVRKTKSAVVIHKLLSQPLVECLLLISVIMYKCLEATPLQVAVLAMLKPSVSLLVLYWTAMVHIRRDHLSNNVFWAGILGRVPFLIFPWVHNPWIVVACVGIYFFFYRASNPAWMEILKVNLPKAKRGKVFSLALTLAAAEGVLIALWVGPLLNFQESAWRILFPITALIGIASAFVQKRVPIDLPKSYLNPKDNWKDKVIKPWKEAFFLMKKREDFRRFQLGFFLCGFGLMMVIPVLPMFYVDTLKLSLKEVMTAIIICQGIGFVVFSKFWSLKLNKMPIFQFMSWVMICFIAYAILLIFSVFNIQCLYVACFIYGAAQAGSQLSWSLSGPIFAKGRNSTVFTSINILMVGLRGCVAPLIGSLCYRYFGPYAVICALIVLTMIATRIMIKSTPAKQEPHFS